MISNSWIKKIQIITFIILLNLFLICLCLLPNDTLPSYFNVQLFPFIIMIIITIRRADYFPYWLVAFLFISADFLLSQPLGLWSLIALLTVKILRENATALAEMLFLYEWAVASLIILSALIFRETLLFLSLSEGSSFKILFQDFLMATIAYPFCLFGLFIFAGIKKDPVNIPQSNIT